MTNHSIWLPMKSIWHQYFSMISISLRNWFLHKKVMILFHPSNENWSSLRFHVNQLDRVSTLVNLMHMSFNKTFCQNFHCQWNHWVFFALLLKSDLYFSENFERDFTQLFVLLNGIEFAHTTKLKFDQNCSFVSQSQPEVCHDIDISDYFLYRIAY